MGKMPNLCLNWKFASKLMQNTQKRMNNHSFESNSTYIKLSIPQLVQLKFNRNFNISSNLMNFKSNVKKDKFMRISIESPQLIAHLHFVIMANQPYTDIFSLK